MRLDQMPRNPALKSSYEAFARVHWAQEWVVHQDRQEQIFDDVLDQMAHSRVESGADRAALEEWQQQLRRGLAERLAQVDDPATAVLELVAEDIEEAMERL